MSVQQLRDIPRGTKRDFSKVWILISHFRDEKQGDYRTTKIADKRVIAINIDGENVQAYYNTNDIDYHILELLPMMVGQLQKNHYIVETNTVVWFG